MDIVARWGDAVDMWAHAAARLPALAGQNGDMSDVRWSMVINCADVDRMSEFWCGVLGLTPHPRSSDRFRVLTGTHGNVALQVADDPVTYRHQMHVDVYCPAADRDAEIERIIALGATRVRDSAEPDDPYVVLTDPEGNELCVCPM